MEYNFESGGFDPREWKDKRREKIERRNRIKRERYEKRKLKRGEVSYEEEDQDES